jgi:hypothetical protein
MKLGLFAVLTGIAVTFGLSKLNQSQAVAADRRKALAPAPKPPVPVTGTAPQEGTDAPAVP